MKVSRMERKKSPYMTAPIKKGGGKISPLAARMVSARRMGKKHKPGTPTSPAAGRRWLAKRIKELRTK